MPDRALSCAAAGDSEGYFAKAAWVQRSEALQASMLRSRRSPTGQLELQASPDQSPQSDPSCPMAGVVEPEHSGSER